MQDRELFGNRLPRWRCIPLYIDQLVFRLVKFLGLDEQLLVQLFTRAQSDLHNINVLIRTQSAQTDHILREIENLYGIAHVQHKQFSAFCHCACRHHKLACLRDRHEVPDNPLVRQCHGTASFDLFFEQGNH